MVVANFNAELEIVCSLVISGKAGTPCLSMLSNSIVVIGFADSINLILYSDSKLIVKETVELPIQEPIYYMSVIRGEIYWTTRRASKVGRIVWPGGLKL